MTLQFQSHRGAVGDHPVINDALYFDVDMVAQSDDFLARPQPGEVTAIGGTDAGFAAEFHCGAVQVV